MLFVVVVVIVVFVTNIDDNGRARGSGRPFSVLYGFHRDNHKLFI